MPGKNLYSTQYDLDSRRKHERDSESGEMKENPWHKHCKEYATKNNVSYAAAISLAGPSWRAYKEKHGLEYRDRSKRSEERNTPMEDSRPYPCATKPPMQMKTQAEPKKPRAPRKPKETFRKGQGKRSREEESYRDFDEGELIQKQDAEELDYYRKQEAKRRRTMRAEEEGDRRKREPLRQPVSDSDE